MSDRVQRLDKNKNTTDVFVKPDGERLQQPYIYYRDLNGCLQLKILIT
jgi:hypothetical protein